MQTGVAAAVGGVVSFYVRPTLAAEHVRNIGCRDNRGRFHMTYRYSWWDASVRDLHPSIGEDKAHWFRESVGYATSDDGIHGTADPLARRKHRRTA